MCNFKKFFCLLLLTFLILPFSDVVPKPVQEFYQGLTDDDKKDLKEIAANHAQYENEDQALEALKAKNEKLYNKAVELRALLKTKIDALSPGAKTFVEGVSCLH